MPERSVILVAEDDEDYVVLIKKAFSNAKIFTPIHVVWNGEEVIAYLKGEGRYSNREEFPLPDLLLLDLKMPRMNGFEVLQWVRAQPSFATLRILVLTSSDRIPDVNEAYKMGANSFLVKPYDFQDLSYLTNLIQEFWLKASKSPEIFRPKQKDKPENGSEEPNKHGR